jgi:DNA primase
MDAVAKTYQIDVELLRRLVNKLGSQIVVGLNDTNDSQTEPVKGKKSPEDGIQKSQKLMLTWLIEDHSLFEKIKGFLGPEDFTEGIYKEVAALVFDQYEKEHAVIPAKIINCFQNKEEQSEVAGLFSAEIRGEMDEAGWQKALAETLLKLKENSLDRQSQKAIEVNDSALLMRIIEKKMELKKHNFKFTV